MNLDELNNETKKKERKPKKQKTPKTKSVTSPRDRKMLAINIALGFSICGFLVCVGSLIWYNAQSMASKKTFSEYAPTISLEDGEELWEKNKELVMVNVNGVYVWDKYVDAYIKNHDCIGWIQIPNTKIDYPVAQSLEDDDYYLHRDLDRNYSFPGTIFADINANISTLSNNVTLYGHHMKNGSMFAGLEEYESEKFYKKHKNIYLDTINGHYTYEVVSAFRISADDDFKYTSLAEAQDREEVLKWLDEITARSYLKDTYATVDDKFITLSTCDYHEHNGRFVVVARQVDSTDSYQTTYISLDEYQTSKKENKNGKKENSK